MDADDRYCLGCKRTLNEIARWGEMSEAERSAVAAQLPVRRADSSMSSNGAASRDPVVARK